MRKTMNMRLEKVPLSKIRADNHKLRSDNEPDRNLRRSIYEKGQISPLLVNEKYELISGHRRYNEMKKMGSKGGAWILKEPIRSDQILEYQLEEVLHSKDLNPIDKARAFKTLIDKKKVSIRKLAKILHTSKTSIEWHLKLLGLPKKVKEDIASGKLKPYGRRMEGLYGKHKIRNTKDFDSLSNSILYDSLIKRLTSMRYIITQIKYTDEQRGKAVEMLKELIALLEVKEDVQ